VEPSLGPGSIVIVYLKEPRERFFGALRAIDDRGVVVQGLALDSFDDWLRQVAEGGTDLSPSVVFFPLLRVEKILLDAPAGPVPSLAERFERRAGRTLLQFLGH
jgi:hypothetical protein